MQKTVPPSFTGPQPPCSGIIVINPNNETILVSTKYDNFSFPKGKRKKGEISIDTAWREFNEETGLTKEDIELIKGPDDNYVTLSENSNRNNIATQYFVGKLITTPKSFQFDPDELKTVVWVNVDDACSLDKLKDRRKELLKQASAFLEKNFFKK